MPAPAPPLRAVMHGLTRLGCDGNDHHARHVHMHPNQRQRLLADPRLIRQPAQPGYLGGSINALIGLDIVTTTGQADHSYRVTDQHGCLLLDSRSGYRVYPNPAARA